MTAATMTVGWRPRPRSGPALRRVQLPYASLAVSLLAHAAVAGVIAAGAALWNASPSKTYIVNLVPAVPAVGTPEGRPTPAVTRRVEEPAPRREPPAPPRREARETPPPALPERARDVPSLPERARESAPPLPPRASDPALPERAAAPRAPALPRPGDKELPPLAPPPPRPVAPSVAAPPSAAALPSMPTVTPAPPREAAAPPRGRPTGSPQGAGALSLEVGDFPFAWYLRAIQRKIEEAWRPVGREGQHAVVVFEILRDGQVRGMAIEKSSGDPVYDQAALRAVADATPFPRLPDEFQAGLLRVHLGFTYRERG